MRRGVVCPCGTADEGGGQAPRKANEDEAQDVIEDGRLVTVGGGRCRCHGRWRSGQALWAGLDRLGKGFFEAEMEQFVRRVEGVGCEM